MVTGCRIGNWISGRTVATAGVAVVGFVDAELLLLDLLLSLVRRWLALAPGVVLDAI
jgi:hypothetical protein